MGLSAALQNTLTLPAVCAPMFLVSTVALVREACKAGVMGVLPRQNLRSDAEFEQALRSIRADLDAHATDHPGARIGPLAVNLSRRLDAAALDTHLALCRREGVTIVISSMGDPTNLVRCSHDHGIQVYHDVVNLRHADKAITAGVDGLICIGAGGGGHSGTISHLALIPRIRAIFDGVVVMAGAITNGAAIRAAEVLGADLAYMGTRFIATAESGADPAYKAMLVNQTSADLLYTDRVTGVPANWLKASLCYAGLGPAHLPQPAAHGNTEHLPARAKPWKNLWSAGQGIDLIHDLPSVAELVDRLRAEYATACRIRGMSG